MLGNYRVAAQLVASRVVLSSTELVSYLVTHLFSRGLSGPRSRPTTTQKIWKRRESNSGPLGLQPGTLTTRPQRRSVSRLTNTICVFMPVTWALLAVDLCSAGNMHHWTLTIRSNPRNICGEFNYTTASHW
jgi:hypothetical protein